MINKLSVSAKRLYHTVPWLLLICVIGRDPGWGSPGKSRKSVRVMHLALSFRFSPLLDVIVDACRKQHATSQLLMFLVTIYVAL